MNIRSFLCGILLLLPTIAPAEELTVILYTNGYPPYSFPKESPYKGIYLDILEEVANITGDKFVAKYYPAKRKLKAFESGLMHIEPGVNPAWRKSWKDISVYSIPFGVFTDVIFFKKGNQFSPVGPNDLKGKKILTVRGYRYPIYESNFQNNSIIRYDINNEFQMMNFLFSKNRDADAGFINKDILRYYMNESKMKFHIGDPIGEVPVTFRFHINKKHVIKRFNSALTSLINNGTIESIIKKYQ
ncbi:MAG: transporter substrate-binding domain-containing protein [Oleispira sp.]|nr:transporter substrate-binding domain-containing protein [Oleispira sp.]MBL4882827.1 transporter substrate-binding domain-containing protein [Oleispira sp.]